MKSAIAVWVFSLLMAPAASRSTIADEPERITVRGTEFTVWPIEDLRKRGFDITELPRLDNAAYIYLEAINLRDELPKEQEAAFEYAYSKAWPDGEAGEQLAAWLGSENNRKALDLARQASTIESCQFPYFGSPETSVLSVMLPNLSECRTVSKMLIVHGRMVARHKKYVEAYEDISAVHRMGRHVEKGITLIEGLVSVACRVMADQAMIDLVLSYDLAPELLKRMLEESGTAAPERPPMERCLRMEKQLGLSIVDEFTNPRNFIRLDYWSGMQTMPDTIPPSARGSTGWDALEADFGRLVFPDRAIKKHMTDYYDEMTRRAGLPFHEAWVNDGGWEEHYVDSLPAWDIVTRILLPSVGRAVVLGQRADTMHRMTRLAVALRLHAAEHKGEAPDRLEPLAELVGGDEGLIDTFSGKNFVYLPDEKTWTFYSISENQVDDGGERGPNDWILDYAISYPPEPPEPFTPASEGSTFQFDGRQWIGP